MWLLKISLILAILACTASGCVSQPCYCRPAFDPMRGGQIARCEATGMSHADCCDSHPDQCG